MSVASHRNVLPQWLSPLKLAAQGVVLKGVVLQKQMLRLADVLISVDTPISVDLHFYCDEFGFRIVSGQVTTRVRMDCQRCMQEMEQVIAADVRWAIVANEEKVEALPKHYDPWVLVDGEGDLHAIIEEELLLALPIVAFHDMDHCGGNQRYSTGNVVELDKKQNPFEALRELKLR